MKCKVVPSHRVKSKPYNVWALIEKDSKIPGGTVKSAYCSCVAGLVGICNHVVALVFRIEHAVRFNLSKPTFTSKSCIWNVPSGSKVDMAPKRRKDFCFDKAQYMKEGNSKNKITASKRKFLVFSLSWSEIAKKITKTANKRHELYKSIKEDIKGSCLWEVMEGRSLSKETIKNKEEVQCPTLLELVQKYSTEKGNNNTTEFYKSVVFTSKQILFVKSNTVEQSQSDY